MHEDRTAKSDAVDRLRATMTPFDDRLEALQAAVDAGDVAAAAAHRAWLEQDLACRELGLATGDPVGLANVPEASAARALLFGEDNAALAIGRVALELRRRHGGAGADLVLLALPAGRGRAAVDGLEGRLGLGGDR